MATGAIERRLRIVIADDHPSVRQNLGDLLSAEPDLEVVGVAKDAVTALRMTLQQRPEVLVIDYDLPDYDGFTVARALRRDSSKVRVVLYTMNREVCAYAEGTQVDACLGKDVSPAALLDAIRKLRPASRKRPRVLVVEDDAGTRGAIRAALEDDGLEIVETGDGFEALAECERQAPGIVVLDLGLPTMSGQEFVTAYRNLGKESAPIGRRERIDRCATNSQRSGGGGVPAEALLSR